MSTKKRGSVVSIAKSILSLTNSTASTSTTDSVNTDPSIILTHYGDEYNNFVIKSDSRYFSLSDKSSDPISSAQFKFLENPFYYLDEGLMDVNDVESKDANNKSLLYTWENLNFVFRITFSFIIVSLILISTSIFIIQTNMVIDDPVRNGQKIEKLTRYKYGKLNALKPLIDPDTPKEAYEQGEWKLVFSDEFNTEGRTFHEGDDQFFTAMDLYYLATQDLEVYDPTMVTTRNGSLQITFLQKNFPPGSNDTGYVSGMIQSWNKLCFNKQVKVEVSAKLPYEQVIHGLWPAVWSLGNLARPGYLATSDGIWPYTYNECDLGITPNQSSRNQGMSYLPGQRLSKCVCQGEDHPSVGVGRGAPEIDIIEGLYKDGKMLGVQTLQLAPFDEWWRPDYDYVYIKDKNLTYVREDIGTFYQESVSLATDIKRDQFQKFSMEYKSLGNDDSYIEFSIDDIPTFTIKSNALHPNEYIGWRQISKEPMSLILNMGLSREWNNNLDLNKLQLPAIFEIDYIRIYQPQDSIELTCDPQDYPTHDYIESHRLAYEDSRITSWSLAGFHKPKNSLENDCLHH
ncbi:uncharacterized protein J8A68_002967 [[Candida] subhashii]|uniref:GH16 domain-containing protein n=1 Tax=[Candida] subhashii TaxID=561895 RepID=A0A8J5QJX3_9ASCO|nr:uncharacterized protein J8A68_002967 [[Candida] subhashii]KAG7663508.1 hypothetical protein J8A68_002967 [[Candida] subhashii]